MSRVPPALRERLGEDATGGLVDLLNDTGREWSAGVTGGMGDRFERRLTEETSKVRVDMASGFAGLRQEMAEGLSAVRQEMIAGFSALRVEMAAQTSAIRQEMAAQVSALRQEMADQRFDILKWAFLFWIGQFFAVASLIALLIRFLRPPA